MSLIHRGLPWDEYVQQEKAAWKAASGAKKSAFYQDKVDQLTGGPKTLDAEEAARLDTMLCTVNFVREGDTVQYSYYRKGQDGGIRFVVKFKGRSMRRESDYTTRTRHFNNGPLKGLEVKRPCVQKAFSLKNICAIHEIPYSKAETKAAWASASGASVSKDGGALQVGDRVEVLGLGNKWYKGKLTKFGVFGEGVKSVLFVGDSGLETVWDMTERTWRYADECPRPEPLDAAPHEQLEQYKKARVAHAVEL